MTKKENLLRVKQDLENRHCIEIHLIWSDYQKTGIGNPKAIKIAMEALIAELDRQISEC